MSLCSSLLLQFFLAGFAIMLPIQMRTATTAASTYAVIPITSLKPRIYLLRRDETTIVRRVPRVLGRRPFVMASAPRPKIKNALGMEGSQQPVIEGNPLPLLSNSAALLNTGVSVPPVPPLTQPTIQIQVGSFFSPDPNLQGPIGSSRRNGRRGVYVGGFDGSGEPLTTPVRIISKPTPIYSEEGLRFRIQGDVVVYVEFRADGTARVVRIVGRLGHGLDEAAVFAVERIRFKPATVNGRPIDFEARARVEFSLIPASSTD